MSSRREPRTIFIGHVAVDAAYCSALVSHLAARQRNGLIEILQEHELLAGADSAAEIQERLAKADLVLLLVSSDFVATSPLWDLLPSLRERADGAGVKVVPILVRPVDITGTPLAQLHALPADGTPIGSPDNDERWRAVAVAIGRLVDGEEAGMDVAPGDAPPGPDPARLSWPRKLLDRLAPRLHHVLMEHRVLQSPADAALFQQYIEAFRADMAAANRAELIPERFPDTVIPLHAGEVPPAAAADRDYGLPVTREDAIRSVRRVIRAITGLARGGDHATAPLAAVSRRSRVVRDIVRELLRSNEPVVLLGDPGSGKSVVLRQVAYELAEMERLRAEPRVVVYIRLGRFRSMRGDRPGDVQELIREQLRIASPALAAQMERLEAERRLVVLLDGMDEMERRSYGARVAALSVYARRHAPRVKTLFACRINDFSPEFEHRQLVLLNLEEDQIRAFLRSHLRLPLTIGGESLGAGAVLKRLLADDWLRDAAANPLLLYLVCHFLEAEGRWPQTRSDLFSGYVKVLQRRTRQSRVEPDDLVRGWARFAFEITMAGAGIYSDSGVLAGTPDEERAPALLDLGKHGGLLVADPAADGAVRFVHHRMQEYFAALHIKTAAVELEWESLLDVPRWQETLLNLVSLGGGTSALRALHRSLVAIAGQLPPAAREEPDSGPGELTQEGRPSSGPQDSRQEKAAFRWEGDPERECTAADRVVLASHVLRECGQDRRGLPEGFFQGFMATVKRLAERGNPSTQVKMLWACSNMHDLPLIELLAAPLASKVGWVRDQALMTVMGSRRREIGARLADEIAMDLANEQLLRRLPLYLRWLRRSRKASDVALVAGAALLAVFGLLLQLAGLALLYVVAMRRPTVAPAAASLLSLPFVGGQLAAFVVVLPLAWGWLRAVSSWTRVFVTAGVIAALTAGVTMGLSGPFGGALLAFLMILCGAVLLGQWVGFVSYGVSRGIFLLVHRVALRDPDRSESLFDTMKAYVGESPFMGFSLFLAVGAGLYRGLTSLWLFVAPVVLVGVFVGARVLLPSKIRSDRWSFGLAAAMAGAVILAFELRRVSPGSSVGRAVDAALAYGMLAVLGLLPIGAILSWAFQVRDRWRKSEPGKAIQDRARAVKRARRRPAVSEGARPGKAILDALGGIVVFGLLALVFTKGCSVVGKGCTAAAGAATAASERLPDLRIVGVVCAGIALLWWLRKGSLAEKWEVARGVAQLLFWWGLLSGGMILLFLGLGTAFGWLGTSPRSGLLLIALLAAATGAVLHGRLKRRRARAVKARDASPREWKALVQGATPREQAQILDDLASHTRGMTPESVRRDLQELEAHVKAEPALSAYWRKRLELDQVMRQRRLELSDVPAHEEKDAAPGPAGAEEEEHPAS